MLSPDQAAVIRTISDEDLAAEVERRRRTAMTTLDTLRTATLRDTAGKQIEDLSKEVAATVERAAGIFFSSPSDILGRSRTGEAVRARHCVFLALVHRGHAYNAIARILKLNHGTVMHGCYQANRRNESDHNHRQAFERLTNEQA